MKELNKRCAVCGKEIIFIRHVVGSYPYGTELFLSEQGIYWSKGMAICNEDFRVIMDKAIGNINFNEE